jgi:large subunit ribosomal protein L15
MMRLHNLRPRPGSRHRVKRLGCGESSGTRENQREGAQRPKSALGWEHPLGFEGGQMPLIRRLPKRGFNNAAFHKHYAVVNVSDLNAFKAGTVVNEQLLRESNLIRGHFVGIKILGDGELKHDLKVQVDKISTTAREKLKRPVEPVTLREARRIEKAKQTLLRLKRRRTPRSRQLSRGLRKRNRARRKANDFGVLK